LRPQPNARIERYRRVHPTLGKSPPGENYGFFIVEICGVELWVIASDGFGWDHVSVSCDNRCPTWDEMCFVKELFFGDDETVIQFHPKMSKYINQMPFCLHLWKRQGSDYELPPAKLIGVTKSKKY